MTLLLPQRTAAHTCNAVVTMCNPDYLIAFVFAFLLVASVSAQENTAVPAPVISIETPVATSLDTIRFTISFGTPIDIETFDVSDISASVGRVQNLSQNYEMITSAVNGQLSQQQGIFIDTSNANYTTDTKAHLVRISDGGVAFKTIGTGTAGAGNNQFHYPHDVTVDSQGNIYVADTGNHRIQIFNNAGTYQKTIGAGVAGSDNHHFDGPYGVAIDSFGNVYVADTSNHRIQIFNNAGEYQKTIGGAGQFKFPQDLEIDAVGSIHITDTGNNRVVVMEREITFDFEVADLVAGDTLLVSMPQGAVQNAEGQANSASNIVKIRITAEFTVVSATTNAAGDSIVLGMSEATMVRSRAVARDFTVRTATNPAVTDIKVDPKNPALVTLSLSSSVVAGESVMLDYAQNMGAINTANTPIIELADFTTQQVNNVVDGRANAKQLNKAIVPHLTQSLVASTMSAIEERMNVARSGTTQKVNYTIGVPQELRNLQASANAAMNYKSDISLTSLFESMAVNYNGSLHQGLMSDIEKVKDGAINWKQALLDSSFALPLQATDTSSKNSNGVVLWGRGDYNVLDGDSNRVDWDGDVRVYQLGADTILGNGKLVGGIISRGVGNFDYSQEIDELNSVTEKGSYFMRLISVSPYVGLALSDSTSMWGNLGYGKGDLKIDVDGNVTKRVSDVNIWSFGLGIKKRLPYSAGDSTLAVKSDMALARTEIEGNDDSRIDRQTISSQRLRVLLNWSRKKNLGDGRSVTPSVETGLRFDGGAGQNNAGLDLTTGFNYANPTTGLTLDIKAHVSKYDDTTGIGYSGSVGIEPGHGHGLGLKLRHGYGSTVSGAGKIWAHGVRGNTNNSNQNSTPWGGVYLGYGLPVSALDNSGLLTPYSEAILSESAKNYRLGIKLSVTQAMELALESEYRDRFAGSTWSIFLHSALRF